MLSSTKNGLDFSARADGWPAAAKTAAIALLDNEAQTDVGKKLKPLGLPIDD